MGHKDGAAISGQWMAECSSIDLDIDIIVRMALSAWAL